MGVLTDHYVEPILYRYKVTGKSRSQLGGAGCRSMDALSGGEQPVDSRTGSAEYPGLSGSSAGRPTCHGYPDHHRAGLPV